MIRFYVRYRRRKQRKYGWKPGTIGYSPSLHLLDEGKKMVEAFREGLKLDA